MASYTDDQGRNFNTDLPKCGVPAYIIPEYDFLRSFTYTQRFTITSLSIAPPTAIAPPVAIALTKIPTLRNYDLSLIQTISSGVVDLRTTIAHEVNKLWPPEQLTDKARLGYD